MEEGKETPNNKVISAHSCGKTLLNNIDLKNKTFASVVGEDLNCDNPWKSALDFTGFIGKGGNSDKNYAVCSYWRYFNVEEK